MPLFCSMIVREEMDDQCLGKFVFSVCFKGTLGATDTALQPTKTRISKFMITPKHQLNLVY